jgi:hypothetical protein
VSALEWLLVGVGVTLLAYLALLAILLIAGRPTEARAFARFIPDCLVLLRRLIGDPDVPRRRKLVLLALVAYLSIPIDLVPDFVPVLASSTTSSSPRWPCATCFAPEVRSCCASTGRGPSDRFGR